VITAIRNGELIDRLSAAPVAWCASRAGKRSTSWPRKKEEQPAEQALPPELAKGQPQDVLDVEAVKKKTRPAQAP